MNIAIFNHAFTDFYTSSRRIYHDQLLYLKQIITGHSRPDRQILCFDLVRKSKKSSQLPGQLSYLKKYLIPDQSEYCFFSQYYQFGRQDLFDHKVFKKLNPQVILITSFAFCYFQGVKQLIAYLKKISPAVIICGGPGPSAQPGFYLAHTQADYVVIGPAELSLMPLLNKLEKKAPSPFKLVNVFERDQEKQIDLEQAYQFKPFFNLHAHSIQLQLTRGCPKKCSYCSIKALAGQTFRKVPLPVFEEEFKAVFQELTARGGNAARDLDIHFEDDNLTFDREYFFNIIQIMRKYLPRFHFSFENGIDFTTLNQSLIKRLVQAGIKQWNISLTSINQQILSAKKRTYTLSHFETILSELEKYNLPIIVYYISGLPGDSSEQILSTLLYLARQKVILGISPYYPAAGVQNRPESRAIDPVLTKASSFYPWAKIATQKLITLFLLSRLVNTIKNIKMSDWQSFKQIRAQPQPLSGLKNLSRRQLTLAGLFYSFKQKQIYAVNQHCQFIPYPLDKQIVADFFQAFEQGLTIQNLQGQSINQAFLRQHTIF